MVEMLTKPLWGRVRPAQVIEFGGSLQFSPPNEMVDFCARNCSFVSGEVSGATVTALALLLIRLHLLRTLYKIASIVLLAAALCLPLAVALQRIAAGRHFLSDTIFAMLFTLLLALAHSALLEPSPRKVRGTRPIMRVTAIQVQAERKRRAESVYRAEERGGSAIAPRKFRLVEPSRGVFSAARNARGEERLICPQRQTTYRISFWFRYVRGKEWS
jgi:hypothetical protein